MTRRSRISSTAGAVALALVLFLPTAALAADPYVGTGTNQQWHLSRVRAPQAWSTTRGSGAIVAVIDTGVRLTHEDLKDRILRRDGKVVGRDFVDDDNDPSDGNGHGTLVAGIIAATEGNGVGGAGVGPNLRIMPLRVLNEDGEGSGSDVSAAIRWAADNGADVINLSLECSTGGGLPGINPIACSTLGGAPEEAVEYAASRGSVVVAAAGNDGSSFTDYSPGVPVLLVGATDKDDELAGFSDRGRADVVVAPGGHSTDRSQGIVSTWCRTDEDSPCNRDDAYGKANGTSFAAPQVAAAVAMLMSQGMTGPEAVARVRATAKDLGSPGPDNTYGYGLLDVAAAVGGSTPDPDPTTPDPDPTTPDPTTPAPDPTRPAPTSPAPAQPVPAPAPTTQAPAPEPDPSAVPTPTPGAPTTPSDEPSEQPVVVGSLGDTDQEERARWFGAGLLLMTLAAHVGASRTRYGAG